MKTFAILSIFLFALCTGCGGDNGQTSAQSNRIPASAWISITQSWTSWKTGVDSMDLSSAGGSGGSSETPTSAPIFAENQIPVTVGPQPVPYFGQNTPMASVTICVPGTSICQTIDDVIVDTGSFGLRLIASAISLPLQRSVAEAGGTLAECAVFASATTWGSVAIADVKLASEVAASAPIQLVGDSTVGSSPENCTNQGVQDANSVAILGANGILGIGVEAVDCGIGCAQTAYQTNTPYYGCVSASSASCVPSRASINEQVTNPVALFTNDNNGVIVQFPSVATTGTEQVTGTVTFGIATQTNNQLGSSSIYMLSPLTAEYPLSLSTQYNGVTYANSHVDSGSNVILFDDRSISQCGEGSSFFCPSSPISLSATIEGQNGVSGQVDFSVSNARAMIAEGANAMSGFTADAPGTFNWGLPLFYGRSVFSAIDGRSASGTVGPYVAF